MSFRRPAFALAALALACAAMRPTTAQSRRPMNLVDIASMQRLLAPRLSPDAKTVAYMASKVDWKLGRPIFHLWRQPIGGDAVQLTFTESGDTPIVRWSPDGKSIL